MRFFNFHELITWSKWTIEQALNLEPPPKPHQMLKPISVKGLNFESQAAFARHIGAHASVVNQLLKTKTPEQIYDKYKTLGIKKDRRKRRPYVDEL